MSPEQALQGPGWAARARAAVLERPTALVDPGPRFFVVSERVGLVGTAETQEQAEARAFYAAIATARTVYVHDRLTELVPLV